MGSQTGLDTLASYAASTFLCLDAILPRTSSKMVLPPQLDTLYKSYSMRGGLFAQQRSLLPKHLRLAEGSLHFLSCPFVV